MIRRLRQRYTSRRSVTLRRGPARATRLLTNALNAVHPPDGQVISLQAR
jgi:hypothetical protein